MSGANKNHSIALHQLVSLFGTDMSKRWTWGTLDSQLALRTSPHPTIAFSLLPAADTIAQPKETASLYRARGLCRNAVAAAQGSARDWEVGQKGREGGGNGCIGEGTKPGFPLSSESLSLAVNKHIPVPTLPCKFGS